MIPKTMKAAVLYEFGQPLSIEEVEVKLPGENQLSIGSFELPIFETVLNRYTVRGSQEAIVMV